MLGAAIARYVVTVRPGAPVRGLVFGRILRPQDAVGSRKNTGRWAAAGGPRPSVAVTVSKADVDAGSSFGRAPAIGQELVELAVIVGIDAAKYVGEIDERVDRVGGAGRDEREESGGVFARVLVADEEVIFRPRATLRRAASAQVIVGGQLGDVEESRRGPGDCGRCSARP